MLRPSSLLLAAVVLLGPVLAAPAAHALPTDPVPLLAVTSYATDVPNPAPRAEGVTAADPTDVYVPVRPPGDTRTFPVALFLQGGLTDKARYGDFARGLAAHGFVVVVPNHLRSLTGSPALYPETRQISSVATWLVTENARAGSPAQGLMDTGRFVLTGHSFGGALALAAIGGRCTFPFCSEYEETAEYTTPANLRAGAFYGTNLNPPGAGIPAQPPLDNVVPVGFVQGSLDTASTPAETAVTYAAVANPPKSLITVIGASHFDIADLPDPAPGTESPTDVISRWTAVFLLAQLGDPAASAYLYVLGDPAEPGVTVQNVLLDPVEVPAAPWVGMLAAAALLAVVGGAASRRRARSR